MSRVDGLLYVIVVLGLIYGLAVALNEHLWLLALLCFVGAVLVTGLHLAVEIRNGRLP